ncbi:GntR family transcriptional regulator [Albirhodobacter sp. R86504]|uniref:GntR family transcriptional regulator n=1 Tax=Albirhodobacter sp. R86504 TaxID=3093848 RepID=UPI003671168A
MQADWITTETVDLTGPVGPQLLAALRAAIIRNQLSPGARISEAEIGARFGLSRQPVREAFIKLAEEGLLEVRPQRGTFVRKVSMEAVLDARFVREAVEADIVKLCAVEAPVSLIATLREQIEAQRKVARSDDPQARSDGFVPLDDLFHRSLAEGAGRANAWAVVDGMKSQMDRVRQLAVAATDLGPLIAQHQAVVDAIEARDPEKAEKAMRGHLQMILTDLPAIRAAFPQYFEGSTMGGANEPR